jgi:hypothetical protein
VEDIEDLIVVAFVTNRDEGGIMQVVSSYKTQPLNVPAGRPIRTELRLYPNPARERVWVNLGQRAVSKGSLKVMDLSGRSVMDQDVPPGYAIHALDISGLPEGLYMVCWFEQGMLRGSQKLVRIP